MELIDYLNDLKKKDEKMTNKKFAEMIKMHRSRLSRILRYRAFPSTKALMRIYQVTKGKVDCWELLLKCSRHAEAK